MNLSGPQGFWSSGRDQASERAKCISTLQLQLALSSLQLQGGESWQRLQRGCCPFTQKQILKLWFSWGVDLVSYWVIASKLHFRSLFRGVKTAWLAIKFNGVWKVWITSQRKEAMRVLYPHQKTLQTVFLINCLKNI